MKGAIVLTIIWIIGAFVFWCLLYIGDDDRKEEPKPPDKEGFGGRGYDFKKTVR